MSAPVCSLGLCDGSGYVNNGPMGCGSWPCACATRDTIPTASGIETEADKCRRMRCEGCPTCIGPGYVP